MQPIFQYRRYFTTCLLGWQQQGDQRMARAKVSNGHTRRETNTRLAVLSVPRSCRHLLPPVLCVCLAGLVGPTQLRPAQSPSSDSKADRLPIPVQVEFVLEPRHPAAPRCSTTTTFATASHAHVFNRTSAFALVHVFLFLATQIVCGIATALSVLWCAAPRRPKHGVRSHFCMGTCTACSTAQHTTAHPHRASRAA